MTPGVSKQNGRPPHEGSHAFPNCVVKDLSTGGSGTSLCGQTYKGTGACTVTDCELRTADCELVNCKDNIHSM
jgi:hypothetical protein